MTGMDLGAGMCPAGVPSVAGYGQPYQTTSAIVPLFLLPDGTQGNVAAIDPQTMDYIIDDNANFVGQDSIQQMVYLALVTQLNSSALLGFGLDISSIKTISSNIQTLFRSRIQTALQPMITSGTISLLNVKTQQNLTNGVSVLVNWQELATGEVQTTTIFPGNS